MTDWLDKAMATASALPPAVQDEIARVIMEMAEDPGSFDYTPEEMARLDASEAEAERGEFATDAQVRAIWAKHGP